MVNGFSGGGGPLSSPLDANMPNEGRKYCRMLLLYS